MRFPETDEVKNAKKNRGFARNVSTPRSKIALLKSALDSFRIELSVVNLERIKQNVRADKMKQEAVLYIGCLRDAVKIIDALDRMPTTPPPRLNGEQRRKLEALRALSLFTEVPMEVPA